MRRVCMTLSQRQAQNLVMVDLWDQGHTAEYIALTCQVSVTTVRAVVRLYRRPNPRPHAKPERNAQLVQDRKRGDTWRVIAERYGISVNRAQDIVQSYSAPASPLKRATFYLTQALGSAFLHPSAALHPDDV
jgi:hypothetical protein